MWLRINKRGLIQIEVHMWFTVAYNQRRSDLGDATLQMALRSHVILQFWSMPKPTRLTVRCQGLFSMYKNLLEKRQNVLAVLVGNAQGLRAQLLLDLQCLQTRGFFRHVSIH
jgi:hypothetical protein